MPRQFTPMPARVLLFRPPPRLPPELLSQIINYVDDPRTLRQCSIAGSCLRHFAQRALFENVQVFIGNGDKRSLSDKLECYSTTTHARHARSLAIRGRGVWQPDIGKDPDLQKLITLLSTCKHVVKRTIAISPASRISSLDFNGIQGTTLSFARIICAFPALARLTCEFMPLRKSSTKSLDRLFASMPPPRLLHVCMRDAVIEGLDTVLFPSNADVETRSLSLSYCDRASSWNSVIRRAATYLEELSVVEVNVEAPHVILDLSANTKLKSVSVGATNIDDDSLLNWVIPSLKTIASSCLESVYLGDCRVEDRDAVIEALRTLDEALVEGPGSSTLRRVEFDGWNLASQGRRSVEDVRDVIREGFPKCHARSILYHKTPRSRMVLVVESE